MSLSVLMSVYKSEKPTYLDRALKSVWDDQNLKPNYIVLVKDGPLGPELDDIVNKWQFKLGENLRIITNENNIGLTKSLNKGIKAIDTDYIARMDTDDISLPDRFKKQVLFLESHSEIVVVGSAIREFNDEVGAIGEKHFALDTEAAKAVLYKTNPLAHPAVMLRRSIFESGISYNEEYRTSQDLALWFDIVSAGYQVANLDEVLLNFRRSTNMYKRRSNLKDSSLELKVHEKGIRKLYGFAPIKSMYPIMRFVFRCLPSKIKNILYNKRLK